MSIWRYNPAEDDYEEIPPDEQDDDEPEEPEPDEPDYCARCRYASRCAGFCAVPPELF